MSAALLRSVYRLAQQNGRSCARKFWFADEPRKPRDDRFHRTLGRSLKIISGLAASCGMLFYALNEAVEAAEMQAQAPSYPWQSRKMFKSLDHAAIRRGWQVYKAVCQTCHAVQYLRFGEMVNVSHTEAEVKAIAAEYEVEDGPDAEGNYYMRPARLSDRVPPPFPNEESAKAANFGANPPDLSYILLARRNGHNYVFSLLTGYMDPPAGVTLDDGQYFNPYFAGGKILMGQMLQEGMVEYDDGTPATVSQMTKDVMEFLSWTSAQEHNARKIMLIKLLGVGTILVATVAHLNRRVWSFVRSKQIAYVPRRKW